MLLSFVRNLLVETRIPAGLRVHQFSVCMMASRADGRTAEDVCQRVMPAHALQMALIRCKRSSLKRRSPTEEEVPYTAADRLAARWKAGNS